MAVDPVPWFIQAPAEHSAEVARTLAYQAIGGKEGLARRGDLTVRPLPVPAGAVQVLPGAAGILNRGPGGSGQAYVGRVGAAITVPIAATGSSAGRTDLIVFQVDDPQYGGSLPASAEQGPYIRVHVVSGVPAGTTRVQDVPGHEADSAITLARVDLPASTGTITTGMVTALADVANPKRERVLRVRPIADSEVSNLTSTTGQVWPGVTGDLWGPQFIPEWATHVQISVRWNGVLFNGNVWGDTWVRVGDAPSTLIIESTRFDSVATSDGYHRNGTEAVGTIAIPAVLRGKPARFYPMGKRDPAAPAASIARMDKNSSLVLDMEFFEE